jgi:3-deoxy-manno-octulosonate cytidylyltransferase (CMP-KDO synthetase)
MMEMGRALAVIPARLSSSRLPRKLLADVAGRPLFVHTLERARRASLVAEVFVATADRPIADAARAHGFAVIETSDAPRNGTERVWEAVRERDDRWIVNVQADEVLIDPATIDAVIAALDHSSIATAAAPLEGSPDDDSVVKVVTRADGTAVSFSRLPIPAGGPYRQHVGIYAFRRDALAACATAAPSPGEERERLEQLRWLENGHEIHVVDIPRARIALNTTRDLDAIRELLESAPAQPAPTPARRTPP